MPKTKIKKQIYKTYKKVVKSIISGLYSTKMLTLILHYILLNTNRLYKYDGFKW